MEALRKAALVLFGFVILSVALPGAHAQDPPLPHAVKLCTNYSPGSNPNVEVCRFLNYHTFLYSDQEAVGRIERAVNQDGDGMTMYHAKLQGKPTSSGSWTTVRSWIGPEAEYGSIMERSTTFADMSGYCFRRAEVKFRVTWPSGADTGVLVRYSGTENICD